MCKRLFECMVTRKGIMDKSTLELFNEVRYSGGLDIWKYAKRTKDFYAILPEGLSHHSRALDIGIAHGYFSILLADKIGCEVHGLDLPREGVEKQISLYEKHDIKFKFGDITKKQLPYHDEHFDLVLFMGILEHLREVHPPYEIFMDIRRVLKPNGYLILSVPNAACWGRRLSTLLGKHNFRAYRDKEDDELYGGHFREYTRVELLRFLDQCGFLVLETLLRNYSPAPRSLFDFSYEFITVLFPNLRDEILIKAKPK